MSPDLNPYTPPASTFETPHTYQKQSLNFKDPTMLTKVVLGLLITTIVLNLISWGMDLVELYLLNLLQSAGEISEEFQNQLEASDTRQFAIGLLSIPLFIAQGIAILMWIYRANSNVRELGAQNMQFTPGWSVGYYFIPVMNLWKPYSAMKEIYQNSQSVSSHPEKSEGRILVLWWFLWLISGFMGRILWRASMTEDPTIEHLINTNILGQINVFIDVFLSISLYIIIKRIYRMQMASH